MTWKKINLKDGTLKVDRSVHYAKGDTFGERKEPKTKNSYRTIKLDKHTIEELKSYKIWVEEKLLKIGKKLSDYPSLPIIFSDDLELLHRSQARKIWDTIVRQAELEHRGYHSLRHSHASNLICDGYPMELVSKRLGHSSIQITVDTYFHIHEEYQKKVDDSILEKVAEKRYGGVTTTK